MPDFVRHTRHCFLGSIACHEINTGPVQRAGNGLGEKRPVVAGVVPGQTTLIACRKPELFHEVHRGACLLGVDRDFAFLINLHTTKGPEQGVGKIWSIAKRMAQRLTNRHTEFFQLLAGREILFPGIGEFVNSHLLENILAIRVRATPEEVRHTAGDPINLHRVDDKRIKLVTPEFGDQLIVVFQPPGVEMRRVILQL
jgi:hypothetical protein